MCAAWVLHCWTCSVEARKHQASLHADLQAGSWQKAQALAPSHSGIPSLEFSRASACCSGQELQSLQGTSTQNVELSKFTILNSEARLLPEPPYQSVLAGSPNWQTAGRPLFSLAPLASCCCGCCGFGALGPGLGSGAAWPAR